MVKGPTITEASAPLKAPITMSFHKMASIPNMTLTRYASTPINVFTNVLRHREATKFMATSPFIVIFGSIKPVCSPVPTRALTAPKMLPLSPKKPGTMINKPGKLSKTFCIALLARKRPAKVPPLMESTSEKKLSLTIFRR